MSNFLFYFPIPTRFSVATLLAKIFSFEARVWRPWPKFQPKTSTRWMERRMKNSRWPSSKEIKRKKKSNLNTSKSIIECPACNTYWCFVVLIRKRELVPLLSLVSWVWITWSSSKADKSNQKYFWPLSFNFQQHPTRSWCSLERWQPSAAVVVFPSSWSFSPAWSIHSPCKVAVCAIRARPSTSHQIIWTRFMTQWPITWDNSPSIW